MMEYLEALLRALRPAFTRQATFVWFVVAFAGVVTRHDVYGVSSIVRALSLAPVYYPALLHFFHSTAWTAERLYRQWEGWLIDATGRRTGRRAHRDSRRPHQAAQGWTSHAAGHHPAPGFRNLQQALVLPRSSLGLSQPARPSGRKAFCLAFMGRNPSRRLAGLARHAPRPCGRRDRIAFAGKDLPGARRLLRCRSGLPRRRRIQRPSAHPDPREEERRGLPAAAAASRPTDADGDGSMARNSNSSNLFDARPGTSSPPRPSSTSSRKPSATSSWT